MIPARSLVRLYPYALRDRWGDGLEEEVRAGGWRAVPNMLAGVAGGWLHPVVWPAGSPAHRRRRAAVMAFAIALTGSLLGHFLVENGPLPDRLAHSRPLALSDLLLVTGLLLVAPWPRLDRVTIGRLAIRGLQRLGLPGALGAAVVAWANHGATHASPAVCHLVLIGWWAVLVLGAVQTCRFVADLDRAAPSLARLRLGLWSLVAALAGGGAIVLLGSRAALPDLLGAALMLLTLGCFTTLRDLYEIPAAD